jgi:hypothetical protein
MGIVDSAEAIVVGDIILPRMLPLQRRPHHNDAFVIIQLSLTGLTLQGNTSKI